MMKKPAARGGPPPPARSGTARSGSAPSRGCVARRPTEMWTGDALHGPVIGGRKTYLFAFIDDHSRLITGHRFGHAEDTVRLAAALRPALASRGIPERIYVDYAGVGIMPSPARRACWPGVSGQKVSA